jgi:hypothetical protein
MPPKQREDSVAPQEHYLKLQVNSLKRAKNLPDWHPEQSVSVTNISVRPYYTVLPLTFHVEH